MNEESANWNPELKDDQFIDEDLDDIVPNTRFSKTFISELFTDIYGAISNVDKFVYLSDRLEILSEMVDVMDVTAFISHSYADFLHYFTISLPTIDNKELVFSIMKILNNALNFNSQAFPFSSDIVRSAFAVCFLMDTSLLKLSFEILYTFISEKISTEIILSGFSEEKFIELVQFIFSNSLSDSLLRSLLNLLSFILRNSCELCHIYCDILFGLPPELYLKNVYITCTFLLCLIAFLENGLILPPEIMKLLDEIIERLKSSLDDQYITSSYEFSISVLKEFSSNKLVILFLF